MLQLVRSDVCVSKNYIEVFVRKQKNDPNVIGMRCWIPRLPELGLCCPHYLLNNWCAHWDLNWKQAPDGFLFCTTHNNQPKAMSYDSWRKALQQNISGSHVGSHSLRKGGARWWRFDRQLPDDIVQSQGGWTTPDCMRAFYAKFSVSERRDIVISAASRTRPLSGGVGACASASSSLSHNAPIWQRPL